MKTLSKPKVSKNLLSAKMSKTVVKNKKIEKDQIEAKCN